MSETAVEAPGAPDDTTSGDAGEDQHTDTRTDGNGASGSTDNSDRAGTGRDEQGRFAGSTQPAAEDGHTAKTIAAIRDDFKAERSKRQAAEKEVAAIKAALESDKAERTKQMDALAIALGLKSGDEPPDPAKLAEELKAARESAQAEISQRDVSLKQATVELAVLRNAAKNGANGDALLDSRSFMAKVSGLDPAAEDFSEQLADAIKAAVEAGPQYKAAGPSGGGNGTANGGVQRQPTGPARSGGEAPTSPGGNRQWTLEDIKAHTAEEVVKAQDAGLLVDLGYNPRKNRR